MFGKKKTAEAGVETVADATTQQRPSTPVEVRLPNPPRRVPAVDLGIQDARADQDARNLLANGSIDSTTVAASTDEFPPQRAIRARAEVDISGLPAERAETEATGDALIARAEQGEFVSPCPHALSPSAKGIEEQLATVTMELAKVEAKHDKTIEVLEGTATSHDGSTRPGELIAPDTDEPEKALKRVVVRAFLMLCALGLVEGLVVTGNQIAYLRLPFKDSWHGVAIAVVAVLLLTYAPHVMGQLVGPMLHGAAVNKRKLISIVTTGLVWLASAIAAALVRVNVDRAAAIRAAEDARDRAVNAAFDNPQADPNAIPPVDPSAVFDPTLPILMWMAFLIGMGVVFAVIEAHTNPVRVEELRYRVRVKHLTEKKIALTAQADAIATSVELQTAAKALALQMWDAQEEIIRAGADHSVLVFEKVLAEVSGDPDMLLALERHRSEVARRAKAASAEAGAGAL